MPTDTNQGTRTTRPDYPHPDPCQIEVEREAIIVSISGAIGGAIMGHVGDLGAHYKAMRECLWELYRRRRPGDERTDAMITAERTLKGLVEAYGQFLVAATAEGLLTCFDVGEFAYTTWRDRDRQQSGPEKEGAAS